MNPKIITNVYYLLNLIKILDECACICCFFNRNLNFCDCSSNNSAIKWYYLKSAAMFSIHKNLLHYNWNLFSDFSTHFLLLVTGWLNIQNIHSYQEFSLKARCQTKKLLEYIGYWILIISQTIDLLSNSELLPTVR